MREQSSWPAVWTVAGNFLRASFGFCLAWGLWRMAAVEGFELFRLLAALFALAGGIRAIRGLVGAIRLILRHRAWARYERQGAKPRADRLADRADLKRRGIIK